MWDTEKQKQAIRYAIKTAEKNDVKVVFDVADPFAVKRNKQDFLKLIKKNADIVLANEEEAKILCDKNAAESAQEMGKYCSTAVVKCGSRGSIVWQEKSHHIRAFKVSAVDTTGAGDTYAAGFLYGLCKGYPVAQAARFGSYLASEVVKQVGAQIENVDKLKLFLKSNG
jgi:sugar/nucleoside kinase (ribokinase family)